MKGKPCIRQQVQSFESKLCCWLNIVPPYQATFTTWTSTDYGGMYQHTGEIGLHLHPGPNLKPSGQKIAQIGVRLAIGGIHWHVPWFWVHSGGQASGQRPLFLAPGGQSIGAQPQGGTGIVPGSHAMSHLAGGGLGFATRVLGVGLGLAIGAQPHGGTGVVPGTQTMPHLVGGGLGFATGVLDEVAIGRQPHGGTGSVPGTQTIPHLNGGRMKVG